MSRHYRHKLRFKRKSKRGVVRTIDFLVSFTLFIILVSQFYLIIINVNLNLALSPTTERNPAEQLAMRFLGSTGSPNWGTVNEDPELFGLASDVKLSSSYFNLDLAKLARLNQELNFLPVSQNYNYIEPTTILNQLTDGRTNIEFRISTKPVLNILASGTVLGDVSTISVSTLTWGNKSLANVNVEVYHVSLADGSSLAVEQATTSMNGIAEVNTNINPGENYVAVVFAHSGISWGVTWVEVENNGLEINASGISSFLLNKPDTITNSIYQFTNNTIDSSEEIFTNTAYFDSVNKNLEVNATAETGVGINRTLTNIGTNAPIIQVNVLSNASHQFYRVLTLPLIMNHPNFISPSESSFEKFQYSMYQTNQFDINTLEEIHVFNTIVLTDRGPLLYTVEAYKR